MNDYQTIMPNYGTGNQSNERKSDWQEGTSLCIALGGTGTAALKRLKGEVYRRMKPDNSEEDIPSYKKIEFLVLDTDDTYYFGNMSAYFVSDSARVSSSFPWGSYESGEYFDISDYELTIHCSESTLKDHKEFSWFDFNKTWRTTAATGIGDARQLGRLCLFQRSWLLAGKLASLIQHMRQKSPGPLNIYVLSGLSGGTGSGIFIDVCYILRHILQTLGMDNALIHGYFFLPSVNHSEIAARKKRIGFSLQYPEDYPELKARLESNAYASLRELNYLMNLEKYQGRFIQDYGKFKVDTSLPPVDLCNLISAPKRDGAVTEDGYDYAMSVAVDSILPRLSGNDLPLPKPSRGCNIINITHGEVSSPDLLTYLGWKLFQRFEDTFERRPTLKDLSDFTEANQITLEHLTSRLTKGICRRILYPPFITKSTDIIPGDKRAVSCADTWTDYTLGTLEENFKTMLKDLDGYNLSEQPSSLIAGIFSELCRDYVMDPEKGPFFAAEFLKEQGEQSFIRLVDTFIETNEVQLSGEQRRGILRREEMEQAEQSLAKAHFFNRKRRIKEYLDALGNWYVHLANIDKYNHLKNLLRELRDQLTKMNREFFRPMTVMLDTLRNTFQESGRLLCEGKGCKEPNSWQVVSLTDIQDQLDSIAESLDFRQEFKKLMELIIVSWQDWWKSDEDKISSLISRYITETFASVSGKTMIQWLESTSQSPESVIQKLIRQTEQPFLQGDSQRYLLVPWDCPQFDQAAESVLPEEYQVFHSHIRDRISVIHTYSDVPFSAYPGLADLKNSYENCPYKAGLHLYETEEMDWRRELPPLYSGSSPSDSIDNRDPAGKL